MDKIHIGYDHESINITYILNGEQVFYERGTLEDCRYIEVIKNLLENFGCEVTTELEY